MFWRVNLEGDPMEPVLSSPLLSDDDDDFLFVQGQGLNVSALCDSLFIIFPFGTMAAFL